MRHNIQPESVRAMIDGIEDAPSVVAMTGAMPVTRMVPARPMTNAPHQLVCLCSPDET